MMRRGLAVVFALALLTAGPAFAVKEAQSVTSSTATKSSNPAWAQLTADQKEALLPLQGDWDSFTATRKHKWLEIAKHYKDLSPESKQRMHERMPALARLSPEERKLARENLKKAQALPPEVRQAKAQAFQNLPEEKKQQLANDAKRDPGPPPRHDAPIKKPDTANHVLAAPAVAPPSPSASAH